MKNRYYNMETMIPYDWDDYDAWLDTVYDAEEKKVIKQYYGHGSSPEIDVTENLPDAIRNRIISYTDVVEAICEHLGITDNDLFDVYSFPHNVELYVNCSVHRGRKLKGDNLVLVKTFTEVNRYLPSWHSNYRVEKALVYDKENDVICDVNSCYVELKVNKRKALLEACNGDIANLKSLVHCIAYRSSYSSCDSRNYEHTLNNLIVKGMDKIEVNTSNAVNLWKKKSA